LPSVKRTWGPLLTSLPRALVQASDTDARPLSGALHGVPIAIKDIIDTHDMSTGAWLAHLQGVDSGF